MIHHFADKKYDQYVKSYIEKETHYRYIDVLGVGSYGVTYLIEDLNSNEKFVFKRMKAKHQKKQALHEKFKKEIHLLNEVGLPNTPSVIASGYIKELPFFIMDFIDGKTFEEAMFKDGLSFSLIESLELFKQLLCDVVTLHHKGIVHRDLRIPNILIDNNKLFIIDFGLATYIKENIDLREIENPKKVENHISDLYSLGHFLLFLLYSNYTPINRKERSWQEELQLPSEVRYYIERLLLLEEAFTSAQEALELLQQLIINIKKHPK